jgi:cobalamin biosynthesis Mg chelatase CobN
MGKRKLQLTTVLGAVTLSMVFGMPGASAACHRFSTEVSPASVQEGGTVTVVVSRDNAAADSGIRVSTVDGTARAGSDFAALDQQVNFTGSETERSIQIQITDDQASEGAESFNVHLSDPSGCAVNPNFSVAADKTVTISASDAGAATTGPAAGVTTPTTAPAATTSAPATTTTVLDEPTETETGGDDEDDGGLPVVPIVILIIVLVAAAGIIVIRRNNP